MVSFGNLHEENNTAVLRDEASFILSVLDSRDPWLLQLNVLCDVMMIMTPSTAVLLLLLTLVTCTEMNPCDAQPSLPTSESQTGSSVY